MDDLPRYYIVGERPVKMIRTEAGGLGAYALNWTTGEFVLAMKYLAEIYKIERDDVERIPEEEFNRKVEELRKKIKEKKSGS
jgi:hypothetical protein